MGKEDIAAANAEAAERARGYDQFLEFPIIGVMHDEQLIYSVPAVPNLPSAGGTSDFTITGRKLAGLGFSSTGGLTIAVISVLPDESEATLRVTVPPATTKADYDFFCTSRQYAIRKGLFKVR